jgi:hypothetical protein
MNRMTRFFILALSIFSATGASAAIFDTMDSVDTLKVIAEQKSQKTDRMPAGKLTNPTDDANAAKGDATEAAPTTAPEKKN